MKELSVLVISCDAYSDTWTPFFSFFWKHWPDCPFEVYLGTNHKNFDDPRVHVIKTGDDRSWAENTKILLRAIDSRFVLVFLEDYFLYRFDAVSVMDAFRIFKELNAKYLHLAPTPRPHYKVPGYPMIGEIKKNAYYRTAIGLQFWDVQTFFELLKDGESAWEMETKGSKRAAEMDGFYRTWKPLVGFHNAIVCGSWRRHALHYCERNGVHVATSDRHVLTVLETIIMEIKTAIRKIIRRFPDPVFFKLFHIGRWTLVQFRRFTS